MSGLMKNSTTLSKALPVVRMPLVGFLSFGLLVGMTVAGCTRVSVNMTFVNETDSLLCWGTDPKLVGETPCSIRPRQTTVVEQLDCKGDSPMRVVMTVGSRGPQIYDETKSCAEWDDYGTIRIEEANGEFIVT